MSPNRYFLLARGLQAGFVFLLAALLSGCGDAVSKGKAQAAAASSYELEICGDNKIKNPLEKQLERAFAQLLSGACGDDAFLILSRGDEMTYVQVHYDTKDDSYTLEYQEGSTKNHFATDDELGFRKVFDIFVKYRQNNPSWDEGIRWRRIRI